MIDVDYDNLDDELNTGAFRERLQRELTEGFRIIHAAGDRLPPPSYYAAQIAGIVSKGAESPLGPETSFNLYQEILIACEQARATVLGEEPKG